MDTKRAAAGCKCISRGTLGEEKAGDGGAPAAQGQRNCSLSQITKRKRS